MGIAISAKEGTPAKDRPYPVGVLKCVFLVDSTTHCVQYSREQCHSKNNDDCLSNGQCGDGILTYARWKNHGNVCNETWSKSMGDVGEWNCE